MDKLDYEKVFNTLVDKTAEYITKNNRKAMILGISGGIDSTVVAAICHEVSKKTGIPLIGRSLPIRNKNDEFDVSKLVGEAFCDDFKIVGLYRQYRDLLLEIVYQEEGKDMSILSMEQSKMQTPIANGNIQARLRMIYLYNLASIHNGLVMSTDNQTEYQLGFWTIHGDVGDFDPIQDLWKTEVYGLANWLLESHYPKVYFDSLVDGLYEVTDMMYALRKSIALAPTDGLGISNSDLDQIGAKDYATVDDILSRFIPFKNFRKSYDSAGQIMHPHDEMAESDCWSQLCARHGEDVVDKVWSRHLASEFKRKKAPVYISRELYE